MRVRFRSAIPLFFTLAFAPAIAKPVYPRPQNPQKAAEVARDRAYLRQEFQKTFKKLQVTSQELLKEHEAGRLTTDRLGKDARSIQKCAKTLRTLQALGDMARPSQIENNLNTPQKFDSSIRRLSKLIYDYAHNPVHQSSKVFNTDLAEQAQTDLLAIINLSKLLDSKSKSYSFIAPGGN